MERRCARCIVGRPPNVFKSDGGVGLISRRGRETPPPARRSGRAGSFIIGDLVVRLVRMVRHVRAMRATPVSVVADARGRRPAGRRLPARRVRRRAQPLRHTAGGDQRDQRGARRRDDALAAGRAGVAHGRREVERVRARRRPRLGPDRLGGDRRQSHHRRSSPGRHRPRRLPDAPGGARGRAGDDQGRGAEARAAAEPGGCQRPPGRRRRASGRGDGRADRRVQGRRWRPPTRRDAAARRVDDAAAARGRAVHGALPRRSAARDGPRAHRDHRAVAGRRSR